jgi:hypothetical protein
MRKILLLVIILLCAVKLAIHLVGNQNYGFHRDELLHVSVSEHLAWGYMEFPPFIAVAGKVATLFFDHSLSGIRFFPTLAGIGILILVCLMTLEMGGKTVGSVVVAGIAFLSFLPFYRNHTLFQPVAFDQFFWTLGFYFLILFIKRKENKYLIYAGISSGFGLLNKYTFVIWLAAVIIGLLFYDGASVFKNKFLYFAFAIVLIMVIPNILWQIQNDFPAIVHQQRLAELQLEKLDRFEFITEQLELPFTFAFSLIGLYGLFGHHELKRFRVVGISVVVIFFLMWALKAKPYYFFAAYPVLFAAGAVMLDRIFSRKPIIQYAIALLMFVSIVYYIPRLIPVLPIEQFVEYREIEPDSAGRYILTGDYADMFGWDEQVNLIDSVYQALPANERDAAVIWAENYGEAAAIKVLGDAKDLPDPFCVSGSFWTFGPPPSEYPVCISLGNEAESVNRVFEDVRLVRMITHRYAIDEENNIPVYVCKKPRINFRQRWPELKKYVFN